MNAWDVMTYGNQTFQRTLERVPVADWERGGVCGIWSVKDLVTHLAAYELLLVEILSTFVSDQPTPLFDSYLQMGEAFNDWEVAKRATLTSRDALAEYDEACTQVMALLAQITVDRLRQPGTLPWYGLEYALDDLLVYQYYGHKREHSAQIAVFADQVAYEGAAQRFNDALNARDLDAMMQLMTDTCAFENTAPAPDGARYEGQEAVRAFWDGFFREAPAATIEVEELFGAGERCVMRWRYHWVDTMGQPGHVRGIDLYTLKNGQIAEKLSYVKG